MQDFSFLALVVILFSLSNSDIGNFNRGPYLTGTFG